MKLADKIKWRLQFLSKKCKGRNLKVIIWTLLPARSHLAEKIIFSEVLRCPLIKTEKAGKDDLILDTGLIKFFYPKNLRISHFAIDYTSLIYPYVKKFYDTKIKLLDFFPQDDGPYEKDNIELKKGDWVVDAGANIGMFSLFAAKKVGEQGKVFSFEPVPATQRLLKRNIELNGIKNVEVVPFALGEKKGELSFSIFPESLECSSGFFDNEGSREKVNQITLDEFVEENKIHKIDFIKSDVEGMERNLLTGARNTIKKFKPKLAICIYHRPDDPELLEKIIKDFVPEYKIIKGKEKLFAYI